MFPTVLHTQDSLLLNFSFDRKRSAISFETSYSNSLDKLFGCTNSLYIARVAISDAEYAIISSQHNAIRGHSGVDVSLNRLRKGGYTFPNLESKVRIFIRKCPLCQLTSQIKPLVEAQNFTTTALYPFQVICADHIGPLPKDEEGYQYILVVICAFSRWIELFPTKTTTAEETLYSSALWSMGNC